MKKILIFRIGSLGDSIVAIPALLCLKKKHPKARFYLLTNKSKTRVGSQEVFKIYNIFYKHFSYSKKLDLILIHRNLRSINFDAVYNLAPNRNRLQKNFDYIYFRSLVENNYYFFDNSAKKNIAEFQRLLGVCDKKANYQDYLPMKKLNIVRKNIVFCCGSKRQDNQWGVKNYILIGKFVNRNFPEDNIIFMGDKYDYHKSQIIIDNIKNGINYCGNYNIKRSIRLFEKIKFYFGENTGMMHTAGLSGCQSIALYNYRYPTKSWMPLTKSIQIFPKTKCFYVRNFCIVHNNECVNSIKPKKVIKVLKRIIK